MKNTIFISDTHAPYHHRDTLSFLEAIKDAYDIQIAKSVGDIVDNHSSSFHDIEYSCLSAKDEYLKARAFCQNLSEIFPKMTISIGNHCKMTERKAKVAGIPLDHLKSYNDVYGVDWNWVDHDWFKINEYNHCLMTHAMAGNTLSNAKTHSHCSVQGHYHGTFGLEFFADKQVLRWSMSVGCLIDPNSPAFNYAKLSSNKRPIVGCGALIDDVPILIPMQLKKSGRWNNKV